MFFNSPDLGLDRANPGSFSLMPAEEMIEDLRRDYSRMAGMIIGDPPEFDEVMVSTDDEQIAEVANKYGAVIPFMRSSETSSSFALDRSNPEKDEEQD